MVTLKTRTPEPAPKNAAGAAVGVMRPPQREATPLAAPSQPLARSQAKVEAPALASGLNTKAPGYDLVIVESPTKAREIQHFLGDGFMVRASKGHVRDLPSKPTESRFGVNLQTWEPQYEELGKSTDEIRKLAEGARTIYLATDPDREGEAISWHLREMIGHGHDFRRVTWTEINKAAVMAGMAKPRDIDTKRVAAQECRRVLDRLVGYGASPILSRALRVDNLSAGRVQSVALRLVVDRDRVIAAFATKGFGGAKLTVKHPKGAFEADLFKVDGLQVVEPAREGKPGTRVLTADEAKALPLPKPGTALKLASVTTRAGKQGPSAPFTTSTLQQEASKRLGISPENTMKLAQSLFEGLGKGHGGFITYHRTDHPNLSEAGIEMIRKVVTTTFGPKYLPAKPRMFEANPGAQESHEAIRPTGPEANPRGLEELGPDAVRLYHLIRAQSLACQMADQLYDSTTVDLVHENLVFQARGTVTTFPGWRAAFAETEAAEKDPDAAGDASEKRLPAMAKGDAVTTVKAEAQAKKTKPPKAFDEADLVKELEDRGIGRPSTYASIFATIKARGFVEPEKKGKRVVLKSTKLGQEATDFLLKQFSQQMDYGFTRDCEAKLDDIAKGTIERNAVLDDFWTGFAPKIGMDPAKREFVAPVKVELKATKADCACPKCKGEMGLKVTRDGRVYASCNDDAKTGCKTSFDTDVSGHPKRTCDKTGCGGPVREAVSPKNNKEYAICCACNSFQKETRLGSAGAGK